MFLSISYEIIDMTSYSQIMFIDKKEPGYVHIDVSTYLL